MSGDQLHFIGDLSIQDANVLEHYSKDRRVLEFGSGGSTQIFAQRAKSIISVETDPVWICKTQDNLKLLSNSTPVLFVPYHSFTNEGQFDLIFVDGVPDKRLEFAQNAWRCLRPNGVMIFHDTRRFEYFKEAAWMLQTYFSEIGRVEINFQNSNMTVIQKRENPLFYVNWNVSEGKPLWAYGAAERPDGEGLWPHVS